MKKALAYLIFIGMLFCGYNKLSGQYNQEELFSDLEGDDLFDAVVESYTTSSVLSYAMARDTLYGKVYLVNDSVQTIYTGYKKHLPPGQDPTTHLFGNTGGASINCEHSYPQSKGASGGNPKSDMHHLFPSLSNVNSARGSDPFKEIPDQETVNWYYLNQSQGQIPSELIDSFSEDAFECFEPRESEKGNIARALFYFYTIYRYEALTSDPDFFLKQQSTLCEWHIQDPVDSLEWHRSELIGTHQDGMANPFVLDCSLAERIYCSNSIENCESIGTSNHSAPTNDLALVMKVNGQFLELKSNYKTSKPLEILLYNLNGQVLKRDNWELPAHSIKSWLLPAGVGTVIVQIKMMFENDIKVINQKVFLP